MLSGLELYPRWVPLVKNVGRIQYARPTGQRPVELSKEKRKDIVCDRNKVGALHLRFDRSFLFTSQYKSGTRSCSIIFENRNGKFRSDRPIYNSNEILELGLEILA